MSSLAFQDSETAVAADDFAALEQRILRAVDLLKAERAARAAAESKIAELHEGIKAQTTELQRAETELEAFKSERELVRARIERLLGQLDELTA